MEEMNEFFSVSYCRNKWKKKKKLVWKGKRSDKGKVVVKIIKNY